MENKNIFVKIKSYHDGVEQKQDYINKYIESITFKKSGMAATPGMGQNADTAVTLNTRLKNILNINVSEIYLLFFW